MDEKKSRHPAWAALAVIDALALAYVLVRFPWGSNAPTIGPTPLGWIVLAIAYAVDIAVNVVAAGFGVAVAYAIARDIAGSWRPRWWVALFALLPLAAALALAGHVAWHDVHEALGGKSMTLPDRLVVFDQLANQRGASESAGARLAWIALAAYLAEKYLMRWIGLRWPVPLVALAIVGWPVWIALKGEDAQREWVAAQQWKPTLENATWIAALGQCRLLGPEWRLPRRNELALYLASEPDAIRGWRGSAWTGTASEFGAFAVVMELAPHRSGAWRSNSTPWRDRSLCEVDANRTRSPDWFADRRGMLCSSSTREGMFVSTLQPTARIRGRRLTLTGPEYLTTEMQAAAICIKPAAPELIRYRRRTYPKEEEFRDADAFLKRMDAVCNPRIGGTDEAICQVYRNYGAATNASAGWVTK